MSAWLVQQEAYACCLEESFASLNDPDAKILAKCSDCFCFARKSMITATVPYCAVLPTKCFVPFRMLLVENCESRKIVK